MILNIAIRIPDFLQNNDLSLQQECLNGIELICEGVCKLCAEKKCDVCSLPSDLEQLDKLKKLINILVEAKYE